MDERLSDLSDIPDLGEWFGALTAMMSGGNPPVRRFNPGELLMRRNDQADCFLVILTGSAVVEGVAVADSAIDVGAGALLGELGVLFEGRRRRTVVATTAVIAVSGSRAELEQALEVPMIGDHVASVAGRRLAENVAPVAAHTPKGVEVHIRPLLPADRHVYLAALGSLSLDTLRRRFFVARQPPDAVVERLIQIDYVDHVAWVAFDPTRRGRSSAVGVCRLVTIPDDPDSAQISVGIVDAEQGKGIGQLLVGTLGALAKARGLERITGHVLTENKPMRALCDKAHARWTRFEPGVLLASMAVPDVAALLDDDTARRVAQATLQLGQVALLADA